MERNTNNVQAPCLRTELESYVIGWNSCLRDVVKDMDLIILLRNANPSHRSDFAYKFRDARALTAEQTKEFVKFVAK